MRPWFVGSLIKLIGLLLTRLARSLTVRTLGTSTIFLPFVLMCASLLCWPGTPAARYRFIRRPRVTRRAVQPCGARVRRGRHRAGARCGARGSSDPAGPAPNTRAARGYTRRAHSPYRLGRCGLARPRSEEHTSELQ